jgi:hypothetical protein
MHWITLIAFLPIHSGFSGLWALKLRKLRLWAAALTGLLVLLAPLSLPRAWWWAYSAYALTLVVALARFENLLPDWLVRAPLSPRYWGATMGFVALWGVWHPLTSGEFALGVCALAACVFAYLAKPPGPE